MALFKGRSSLLEVQNRALIKTAKERAAQIEELEAELQSLRERLQPTSAQIDRLERDVQSLQQRAAQIDKVELQFRQERPA
jgi:DNA repair exonuclease SbcCD ATPase subunit